MTESPRWRKSTRSNGAGGNCVEFAADLAPDLVGVRDSKQPDGPILQFTPTAWRSFLTTVADRRR